MASVIITLKIMPKSADSNLRFIGEKAKKEIQDFGGKGEIKIQNEPIAFGLKALKLTFVMDESRGSTEGLENKIAKIEDVNSVDCVDVRRAVG